MRDRVRSKRALLLPMLLASSVLLGWPLWGYAAHDLGQNCYNCHNIEMGQVWTGSYSVWSGLPIGMSPYSRPITCEICHTDYGDRFKATSASHHPVAVIAGASMNSSYDNGVQVRCRDCHNADSVSLTPNLNPDLAPSDYLSMAGNTATDGYPNHDVLLPNNQVVPGDNAHLLSMLLSGGQRTVNGSSVYNKVPSANPSADYAFCLACHDGSANTGRAVNVKQDYIDRGHFFWETAGGITAGDRIPCSDCHASHNSPTNARLIEPDNTTWTGTRPSGLTFANPYAPTNAEYRALCIFCHEDYNPTNTVNTAKRVRGVAPAPRLYGVPGHAGTDTVSCRQCHNPHKTPGGGPECLTCHTSGGMAGARTDYIDSLFKGVGSDNGASQPASVGSLTWSQHGGFASVGGAARFIYASPYNTKGTNDCFKCHGDRHNNRYSLVDADNTDSYAYNPSLGMRDNTASGIANANAFCLTCHDGNGAAADIQIGNQVPPNVAANYAATGHGRPQASGAYTVSLNNPAYLKCIDCHEVHGSNHAKLLPAKKNEVTANFTIPSNFPEKTFRSGGSTLLARDLDFTDYSSPASGKGFGTSGDPGNQHAPSGASTGLCDACHRFAGRANGGTDNVTNKAHTHEGIVGDTNQNSPSQMTFTKDCAECHDTHGTTNLEMVRTTINLVTPVTFTSRNVGNSFDPAGSGNAVCNACHQWSGDPGPPPLNVDHNYRTWPAAGDTSPEHNPDTNCTLCHPHGNATNAAKFGFPQGSCATCHGNAVTGTSWPDNTASDGTYPDRAGAHVKHINAIYTVNSATLPGTTVTAKKNNTCVWCHPGNPPAGHETDATTGANQAEVIHMDNTGNGYIGPPTAGDYWSYASGATAVSGTAVRFRNISGTNDNDAYFISNAMKSCGNVACHAGALTPNWYTGKRYDSTPPVWTGGVSGIAASNLAQGGAVGITWNTATDADNPPVQYTLYWSTNASTVFTAGTFMDNVAATSATLTGLTNGTPYYFGVRAKDSASPFNQTTNTDNVSATPTPTTVTWKLKKSNAVTVYTGQSTNLGTACGTGVPIAAAGASGTYPVPGLGLLTTGALTCASGSDSNFASNSSPATTEEQFVAFYTDTTYPTATAVTGNAAGSRVGLMASTAATHTVRVRLAGVTSAGAHTLSTGTVTQTFASITNTAYPLDLSPLSVTVPAGGRLAVIFTWQDATTTASTSDHILIDNTATAALTGVVSVSETPSDTTAPAWSGGVSGIAVSTGNVGSLQVSWNTAADALTPPVRYDLYRTTVLAGLWSAPYRTNLGTTSIIDSGLTEGTTYYYGVRAKDSVTPTPNVTTNIDNASGTPRTGTTCNACHAAPPVTGGGAGSHAKHARTDVLADCEKCHPGASGYSNAHQDGVGQLGFSGTAYIADYTGGQLTYRDGASTIFYQDADGYGVLTGSVGDNTDTGTCFHTSTSANYCHGNGATDPVWGGTLPSGCGACHNSTGKQAALAPTVTISGNTHTTAPHGAGVCQDCHAGHYMGVTIPLPPSNWNDPSGRLTGQNMQVRLGIDYTNTGGIYLGGASGSGVVASIAGKTTEAEICWGCHKDVGGPDTYGVSEWGYSTKTTPTGYPVVYTNFPTTHDGISQNGNNGWIYANSSYNWSQRTPDWTAGYWMNEYDNSIRYRIASVHSASFDPNGQSSSVANNVQGAGTINRTSPVLENKSYIRCSYCHDVHNLNKAPGDTASGKPFLRGAWIGNPYPPELPPRTAYYTAGGYTTRVNLMGAFTPRGLSTARDRGGYFIDQNSAWPTDVAPMNALANVAGLCTLCHGANVDTMKFYPASTLWRTGMVNGHSNSTLGGTGANKRDLFSATRYGYGMGMQLRVPSTPYVCGSYGGSCDGNYPQARDCCDCYSDCGNLVNSGWFGGVNPPYVGTGNPGGGDIAGWYGTGTIGGAWGPNTMAHKFTCSKCHSPHAAGLPALLTHNCIDTALAQAAPYAPANLIANNCHRKTATTDGWHKLAPLAPGQ